MDYQQFDNDEDFFDLFPMSDMLPVPLRDLSEAEFEELEERHLGFWLKLG